LSLQVLDTGRGAEFLKHQGALRMVRTAELPAYRGLITDRRGEPLAVSTPVVSLWANPALLAGSERLDELAAALELPRAELDSKLERYASRQFMYLRRHLTPDRAREILALNIDGVRAQREYRRFYPAGEVASQLVGVTNVDGRGVAGLELAYDDWLRGHAGQEALHQGSARRYGSRYRRGRARAPGAQPAAVHRSASAVPPAPRAVPGRRRDRCRSRRDRDHRQPHR
jgi:cell division protein FtsI (penicillin-binding protein 3)